MEFTFFYSSYYDLIVNTVQGGGHYKYNTKAGIRSRTETFRFLHMEEPTYAKGPVPTFLASKWTR